MNKKVLKTLEFDKITTQLADYASSTAAKDRCKRLVPMSELADIVLSGGQTNDAMNRSLKQGHLSFSGVSNILDSLKRLEIGASLGAGELLRIASVLDAARRAKTFSGPDDTDEDLLTQYFAKLEPLKSLRDEICRCIISDDEIADDASSTLHQIRRSMRGMNDRIRSQMNSMINNSVTRGYLQDAVITLRDGRYCLPVKAEAKSLVPGMIHDQSSSGSTIFIEPMAVVNLNNEYKELLIREQNEIEVILSDLSNEAATYSDLLRTDYEILTELDFIFAKAYYAFEYNGVIPSFNDTGSTVIMRGRHPLLDQSTVVPIDIRLGQDFNLLIVTGPNTGGKTVSLKTLGLLTLMGQSGLAIPASDRSDLAVFSEIFADIGDEQSIEQSLSTFSSHMTNIIRILKRADDRSLILFDELCAGTDPTEGAALAIAILSKLKLYGSKVMATTHYSELKVFALSTDGVENACCEFNVDTLSPTYRLLIGIPGKSNAFAISKKLGLSGDIIDDAKSRISENEENFEDLLADLERSRTTIEKEQLEIEQYKSEVAALKEQLTASRDKLDAKREKILREANEQAYNIIKEAKDVADETIRSFNKSNSSTSIKQLEQERTKLGNKMKKHSANMTELKKPAPSHNAPKKLMIGDSVKVVSMNLKGTVSSLPNSNGDLTVQMGILNSKVNIKDLILLDDDKAAVTVRKYQASAAGKVKMSKSLSVSAEINLIGKTTDEAISLLDKYLDDAYLAHLSTVRVVHGKGTGALRRAVQAYLKKNRTVRSFHLGEYGEGDAGVTIVEFK
jgi:DNA mismatch repair protein MutS2